MPSKCSTLKNNNSCYANYNKPCYSLHRYLYDFRKRMAKSKPMFRVSFHKFFNPIRSKFSILSLKSSSLDNLSLSFL